MNVISFSLYGNNPWYTIGAIKNAQLAKEVYPDWICYFYHDATVPNEILKSLSQMDNVQLVLANTKTSGSNGLEHAGALWRFYIAADPTIDRWISRDCDSRLNWRERACVDEWIVSGLPFHIMRERNHWRHIMAGMCGGIGGIFPNIQKEISEYIQSRQPFWRVLIGQYFSPKYTDQDFLEEHIWPKIKSKHLAHDANINRLYDTDLPFPSHRELEQYMGTFVGQVLDENDVPIHKQEFPPELSGDRGQPVRLKSFLRKFLSVYHV